MCVDFAEPLDVLHGRAWKVDNTALRAAGGRQQWPRLARFTRLDTSTRNYCQLVARPPSQKANAKTTNDVTTTTTNCTMNSDINSNHKATPATEDIIPVPCSLPRHARL